VPVLRDEQHERVAQELFLGKKPAEASRLAGYNDRASSFEANARKRAGRPDIRARLAELQKRAATLAEIDRGYVLAKLKEAAEYNVADYLKFDENDRPYFELQGLPRELLARLDEVGLEQTRYGLRTKIKGHGRNAALSLIADIIGAKKDPLAEAVTGIGERLKEAFERARAAE
jgi:hypothetical protein